MSNSQTVSAADRAAIENLYACYNHCADQANFEGYADCFTADAVFHVLPADFTVEGRAALIEFQRQAKESRGDLYRRHWNSSLYLEYEGSGVVRARAYFRAFNGEPGSMPTLTDTGVYEDRIVLSDERWRFAERRVLMDASARK